MFGSINLQLWVGAIVPFKHVASCLRVGVPLALFAGRGRAVRLSWIEQPRRPGRRGRRRCRRRRLFRRVVRRPEKSIE